MNGYFNYKDELYHYGVLGMRWGVRRYQPYGKGGYEPKDLAKKIHRNASKRIRKISNDVTTAAKKAGSSMYGLEHRLKTRESLERKIKTDSIQKGISLFESASDIKDAIRFTTIQNEKEFVNSYNKFKKDLAQKGYKEVKCKNYFQLFKEGKVKHKSVQSIFQDKDGYKFEVQFQTPASQDAKNKKVPLYEEARQVGIKPNRLKELEKQMEDLALNVKDPIGIDKIKTY